MLENERSGASIVPTSSGISDVELKPKYALGIIRIFKMLSFTYYQMRCFNVIE